MIHMRVSLGLVPQAGQNRGMPYGSCGQSVSQSISQSLGLSNTKTHVGLICPIFISQPKGDIAAVLITVSVVLVLAAK